MAKKYPEGYIKNPAKVAAGKARQATGIKDSKGKYVTKVYQNEIAKIAAAIRGINVTKIDSTNDEQIKQLLIDAKLTGREVKQIFESKPEAFERLREEGVIKQTFKDSEDIEEIIRNFKGKFIIDNGTASEAVTSEEAIYKLQHFKQYLKSNINAVDFSIMPKISLDGKLTLSIPSPNEIVQKLKEYFDVSSIKELYNSEAAEITEAVNEVISDMYSEDEPPLIIYCSERKSKK